MYYAIKRWYDKQTTNLATQKKTLKALRKVTPHPSPYLLMQHSKIRKANAILNKEIKIVIRIIEIMHIHGQWQQQQIEIKEINVIHIIRYNLKWEIVCVYWRELEKSVGLSYLNFSGPKVRRMQSNSILYKMTYSPSTSDKASWGR